MMNNLTPESFPLSVGILIIGFLFILEAIDICGLIFTMHSLRILAVVLRYIFLALPVFFAFLWLRKLAIKYSLSYSRISISAIRGMFRPDEYAGVISFSMALIATFGLMVLPLCGNRNGIFYPEDYTPSYVMSQTFIMLFCMLLNGMIPNRVLLYKSYSLQQELDGKRILVKYISHEIRTPLNTVCSGLTVLEKRLAQNPEVNQYFLKLTREMHESASVAVHILSDLLDYEKLGSGLMALDLGWMAIVPFLRQVFNPFQYVAESKDINYHCELNESMMECWLIQIDRQKMGQVLRNFISNAVKFTPSGGVVKVVNSIVRYPLPTRLRIEISDTGPGISAENQLRLFNDVVQFNPNAHQEGGGSGIGLWISKKIVDLHGATVQVISEEGKGSTFILDIPVKMSSRRSISEGVLRLGVGDVRVHPEIAYTADAPNADKVSSTPPAHHSDAAQLRILLADDSKVNRRMTARLLESMGHTCIEVSNGAEAVTLFSDSASRPFDCIILDNHMPVMTGKEASRKLRELGYKGQIYGLTGDIGDADIDEFIKSGANSVLAKPIDTKRFDALLRSTSLLDSTKRILQGQDSWSTQQC